MSHSASDSLVLRLAGSEKLRKPRWKLDNLPDLTGKVVMVTNPNNRVGRDTAKVCLPSRVDAAAYDGIW